MCIICICNVIHIRLEDPGFAVCATIWESKLSGAARETPPQGCWLLLRVGATKRGVGHVFGTSAEQGPGGRGVGGR